MTTLLVNISYEQDERDLIAFLDSRKYNYSAAVQPGGLSDAQQKEILRREADFKAGKIKSEPWVEVRKRFHRSLLFSKITFDNKKIVLYLHSFLESIAVQNRLPDSIMVVRRFLVPFV